MTFEPRTYRTDTEAAGLVFFDVVVRETDLRIWASDRGCAGRAEQVVVSVRSQLEAYIARHARFAESYVPVEVFDDAPEIVRAMSAAARAAGVGPMAAVAGAIAEAVARDLNSVSGEVIVENGGDVYLCGRSDRTVSIWTGESGVGGFGLRVAGSSLPLAVATSSGKFGHSVSLGSADTATVVAPDGALADAVATAVANRIHSARDLEPALRFALGVPGVSGVVLVAEGRVGAAGEVCMVPL